MDLSELRRCVLLCLLVTAMQASVQAEDWPQWRGINRDGVWQVDGVIDQLPEGPLEREWEVDIGPGYNGPTVADGRVFVMDRDTSDGQQKERILCFDSDSGALIWKHAYDARYTISYTAGPRASVTIDEGRAYAVGAMGHFHCLETATGDVVWSRDLNDEYEIDMPIWGIAGSPLIYGRLVIQQVAAEGACMVAFDKLTGKEVWRALPERAAYASPILIKQAGRDVLVCWTGESLTGIDPSNGQLFWSHEMQPIKMSIGIGTPTHSEDLLFVSSFYDGSLMVRPSRSSLESELVWRARGESEKKTVSRSVQLKNEQLTDGEFGIHAMIGTAIVKDGHIYATDSYGEFRCLDATTGRRIWEDNTAVPRNRWATIHMVEQADRVWMFTERGELLLTKLSPAGLEVLGRSFLIAPTRVQLNRRDGVCWSHPAFAEKSIFARNDEQLIRVSLAAGDQTATQDGN